MKFRFILLSIVLTVGGQSRATDLKSCIPNNAGFVICLDFERLNAKSNGMDYLKYVKRLVRDYNNRNYYNEYDEINRECEIIHVGSIVEKPKEYGVDLNSRAYVYRKVSQLYSGITYLFKLSDINLFETKIKSVKCLNSSPYIIKETENGKLFMSEKYVIGIQKDLAFIFINDNSAFNIDNEGQTDYYSYSAEARNTDYRDSIYKNEFEAYRMKTDSLIYSRINRRTEDLEAVLNDYNDVELDIVIRAVERLKARQEELLNKKFEKLIHDFETILNEQPNSIALDRNFSYISKENNDVLVFISNPLNFLGDFLNPFSRRYYNYQSQNDKREQSQIYSKNISSAYVFNFENGQLKFKTYNSFGDEGFKIVKKAYEKKQKSDLFKYIDATDLMAFASVSFNSREMISFYEKLYFEYLNNNIYSSYDKNIPVAMELFWAMIDKEMLFGTCLDRKLFAINGFVETKIVYQSYDYDEDFKLKPIEKEKVVKMPRMVLVLGIENKDNAKKLFDIIAKFSGIQKIKDNVLSAYANDIMPINVYLVMNEDAFILTNDYTLAVNNQEGYPKSKQIGKELRQLSLKHNFVMKLYSNKLFKSINENFPNDSREMRKINEIATNLGDLTFNDYMPKDNLYILEGTLNLSNSSANSLETLLKLLESL